MIRVTGAQPGQERRHVLGRHLADTPRTAGGQRYHIPLQVPAVGLQRVRGQAPLDHQVIEIPADGGSDAGQLSTSRTGFHGRPCASATGGQVRAPA